MHNKPVIYIHRCGVGYSSTENKQWMCRYTNAIVSYSKKHNSFAVILRWYSSLTNNELLSNLLSRLYWQLKLFVFFASPEKIPPTNSTKIESVLWLTHKDSNFVATFWCNYVGHCRTWRKSHWQSVWNTWNTNWNGLKCLKIIII